MPTLYPGGLDAPSNPTQTTSMAASGFEHDLQHININDAMRAVQQYLGTTNSQVPGTITFISNNNTANITVLQGNLSTINNQLLITNANVTANTSAIASHATSIANLNATKLNLIGGVLSGQLISSFAPPAVSAALYYNSQIFIQNTKSSDNPPSLGFANQGALGLALYLTANGLNTINHAGQGSLIINSQGQLNPASFPSSSIPGSKIISGTITATELAANSVTSAAIAPGSIDTSKFAASVIPTIGQTVGVPVGTIILYGGVYAPPNYIICAGWALPRTGWGAPLFNVISTAYGAGDGSTTYNVPNFLGRVPVGAGWDSTNGWYGGALGYAIYWGWTGGEPNHTLSVNEMPYHAHSVYDPGHGHGVGDPGHAHGVADPGHAHAVYDPGHSHYQTHGGTFGTFAGGSSSWHCPITASAEYTYAAGTGIAIYGHGTGIGIYGAGTGIWIGASGTGIGIYANGASWAHNNIQPSLGVQYYIKYQ